MPHSPHHTYRFGDHVLDVDRAALLKSGAEIRLRRRAFEVLCYLVRHRDRLVTKDELMATIWAGTVVTDGALTQCLIDIRRALGDDSRQVIRTVPRRGYVFDAPVTEHGEPGTETARPGAPAAGRAGRRRAAALALAALAAVMAVAWWVLDDRAADTDAAVTPIASAHSIAVLPFADMSEHHDQAYFSDGMAEEILNLLARNSDLRVIGRTSSFSFRGSNADIATIAARLNVAWVLEGSVRRAGDRIRVDVRLVDATGLQRWSETYDRQFRDVLDVQSEIAASVAAALRAKLSGSAFSGTGRSADPEAHALYLQGHYYFNRRAPDDLDRAADCFRRALEQQPTLGPAWAGLAGVYWARTDERSLSPAEWREWGEAVAQALAHAPHDADSFERAAQYFWQTGDRERALADMARADALRPDPNGAAMREMFAGRFDAIIAWQRRNIASDPLSATSRHNFAAHLVGAGRLDEALDEFEEALALNPGYRATFDAETALVFIVQRRYDEALVRIGRLPDGYERDAALALVRDALGDRAGSDAALARLSARGGSQAARRVAEVYAQRADIDAAFRWLATGRREATGRGDLINRVWLIDVRLSPFLAPLHEDPRWQELMALWVE